MLSTLDKVLPENSILVADGGDFVATAAYILHPRSAGSWLDPGAFGTLGVGGGFALGAKLGNFICIFADENTLLKPSFYPKICCWHSSEKKTIHLKNL